MRHLTRHANFGMKPLEQTRVMGGRRGQQLQRDWLAQRQVGGTVHFAHPAPAQQPDDPVAARQECPRKELSFVGGGGGGDRRAEELLA